MTMLVLVAWTRQQPMKKIEEMRKMILNNRRITIRAVSDDIGISFGSCQEISMDALGMKRAARRLPKLLNFKQKQRRMDIAQEMLTMFNDDPVLLKKVLTGEGSRLYGYDIETKTQSSQWKRSQKPRPKKPRQVR